MTEFISGYDEEYESFNAGHINGTIYQSYIWGKVKPAWMWRGIKVKHGGAVVGIMGVLIRRVPATGYALMYAPRGPVCDYSDVSVLSELTEGARKISEKYRAYTFKLDTDIEFENDVFKSTMAALGYRLKPVSLDFDNIQPQFVARLDISGKTEDEVFAMFKNKTRYNIRLAQRRGVEIKICGAEALDEFYPIMQTTGTRDGFIIRSREYFENMLTSLGENARLYMAYYDGRPIAGTIATIYGDKVWYQYGASSNEHRDKMPNYLLQWRMIQWAIENNCRIYDFRGVSGNVDESSPHYGLWRFKSGFGASLIKFCGEFEYVYHPIANNAINTLMPIGQKISHILGAVG